MDKKLRLILISFVCFYFLEYISTYTEWHFIDNINLIFHEAGHSIFFFLGEFMQIFMGSSFQILLPLSIAIYFFFQNQKISGSICLMWVGQNFLNVSVYAGDAIKQQLELLGGNENTLHDWNYLLNMTGLILHTNIIAKIIYILGVTIIIIGCLLSVYFTINYKEN